MSASNQAKPRILIADDEPLYLRTTAALLRKADYDCVCVPDAHQAIAKLEEEAFDLILSDLNMPGNLKLELLRHRVPPNAQTPIIVITGVPSLPTAIESIRLGITDYLLKPVNYEDLLTSVRRALAAPNVNREPKANGKDRSESVLPQSGIVGSSAAMQEIFTIIDQVAATNTNVLVTGESGTGKELVAKAIHAKSLRRQGPLQVIDCTAYPEALFESILFGHKKGAFTSAISDQPGLLVQCDGGTAFLDELGELPLPLQAKLLRVVQEQTYTPVGSHHSHRIDTRFVCATNRNLQDEVNAGRFRRDLYYRLGVIHIELPPLRERGNDVIELAEHFLEELRPPASTIEGLTPAARSMLLKYPWPGNIRELRNVIERAVALCKLPQIDVVDLPAYLAEEHQQSPAAPVARVAGVPGSIATNQSREEALRVAEHQYLSELLERNQGNVSEAARQAGLSRQGLHKLLKIHEISAANYR